MRRNLSLLIKRRASIILFGVFVVSQAVIIVLAYTGQYGAAATCSPVATAIGFGALYARIGEESGLA